MISGATKNSYAWPHFGESPKDAQTLIDEARKEAWELGMEEGRAKAFADAQTDIQNLKTNLQNALQDLEQLRFRISKDQIKQLARVSYDINRLILGAELKTNLDIFSTLLRHGVELIEARDTPIRIIVSTEDQQWLETAVPDHVTIVASENQAPGTLRIENENQSVEFDPYEQLNQLFTQPLQGHIDLVEGELDASEQPDAGAKALDSNDALEDPSE